MSSKQQYKDYVKGLKTEIKRLEASNKELHQKIQKMFQNINNGLPADAIQNNHDHKKFKYCFWFCFWSFLIGVIFEGIIILIFS
jgi:hypothetical protein